MNKNSLVLFGKYLVGFLALIPFHVLAEGTWADLVPVILSAAPLGIFIELYEISKMIYPYLIIIITIISIFASFKWPNNERGENEGVMSNGLLFFVVRSPKFMVGITLLSLFILFVGSFAIDPKYLTKSNQNNGYTGKYENEKKIKLKAPNGKPWPNDSDYIDMPQTINNITGDNVLMGDIDLDNRYQNSDVYVKLCNYEEVSKETVGCPGLRHIYLKGGSTFTLLNVEYGEYRVFYRSIENDKEVAIGKKIIVGSDKDVFPTYTFPREIIWHNNGASERIQTERF